MPQNRREEPCIDFVEHRTNDASDSLLCAICGWSKNDHFSYEQLEQAITCGQARIVVDRPKFRVIIYQGFRYACVYRTFTLWAQAAGNKASDYQGRRSSWSIQTKEPETKKYQRLTPKREMMGVDTLIKELRTAIDAAQDGRWQREHWKLVAPENLQLLLAEIDNLRTTKAA